MSDIDEDREMTDWQTEAKWYRRKPGAGWLWAFLAIPVLLALIGLSGLGASKRGTELAPPSVAASASLTPPSSTSASAPEMPAADFGSFSIVRTSNGFSLAGELPSADVKAQFLDSIGQGMPGINLVDNLTINPNVKAPEFAGLGGVFSAAMSIPDFNFKLENGAITLTGNAPTEELKAAAEQAAAAAWSNVKIVNNIQVVATTSPPSPAPVPGAGGPACATLQADITELLRTPIYFDTNGATLAASSQGLMQQIADKVKGCADVKVAVTGYTDNTGNDVINVPLSASRAKAVADALIADGIAAGNVTSSGAGSAKPVASNDTPAGRAQNRRTEIMVS
jgi:peptidoglycan-binding protein ArfA